MTKTEKTILISLVFFLMVGIAVRIAQNHFSKVNLEAVDARRLSKDLENLNAFHSEALRVDLNSAQGSDFDRLQGIGPKLAQKIVQYRNENGKFKEPEDLVNIIGKARYEKLRGYLFVDGKSGASLSVSNENGKISPSSGSLAAAKQRQFGTRSRKTFHNLVNLNNATAEELASLPLIKHDLAERIIEHRKTRGSFKEKNELLEVKGVGVPLYRKVEPYLVVE